MMIDQMAFLSAIGSKIGRQKLVFLLSGVHDYVSKEIKSILELVKKGGSIRMCQVTNSNEISKLLEGLGLKPTLGSGLLIDRYNDIVQDIDTTKSIETKDQNPDISARFEALIDLIHDSIYNSEVLINNYKAYINRSDVQERKPFRDIYKVLTETVKSLDWVSGELVTICEFNSIGTLISLLCPKYFRERFVASLETIKIHGGGYFIPQDDLVGGGLPIMEKYERMRGLAKSKTISSMILFIINSLKALDREVVLPRVQILDILDSLESLESVYELSIDGNKDLEERVIAKAKSLSRDVRSNNRIFIGIPEINRLVENTNTTNFLPAIEKMVKAQILVFLGSKYGLGPMSMSISIDEVVDELSDHALTHAEKTNSANEFNTMLVYYGLSSSDIQELRNHIETHRIDHPITLLDEMLSLIFDRLPYKAKPTRDSVSRVTKLIKALKKIMPKPLDV